MNKLQQVRYAAAYTALAQKLDKHIKQFDSDPNTQIRWIWELIQNAKDAPNRFKQTKIKQSLDDTYFISSHNGDAFQIPQLHSIVAQYSTKKQKNSQATKTTGKYGTGFITTYILSKIIQVSAILKVEIQEDSDDENQNQKNEVKNLRQQNLKQKFNNTKNLQSLDSLSNSLKKLSTQDDNLEDFQKRTNMHFKQKKLGQQKKGQSMFFYKKFSIQMDRSYIDRDEQLPKKIQKTEKKLTKIVMEAEYESTRNPDFSVRDYEQVQRTVDSFDTEFKYKITDKRKFQMIEKTLTVTKQLLPYAFLFNDNLIYYEFIDNRKFKEQDYSFTLTKGEVANIGTNIYLFTYQVQEDYDHKTQKFLTTKIGYIVSYFNNQKAIAAVPVHIDQAGISILKVDEKLPKYFKDFPLIGCSDLKWNALINARQFYPNEKRSQLMLNYYDETNKDKVETNWIHLNSCFGAIKEIYLFLSHHCKSGLENLLIFSSENAVANTRFEFKAYLIQLIKEICLTKIIPNRIHEGEGSQKAVEAKNLIFIELASDEKQIYNKNKKSHFQLSFRANEAFSFLYGNQFTISSDHYAGFYEILNYSSQYRKYLESCKVITFITVNDSLKKMSQLDFSQFCVFLKGNWQDKLHEIYSLLRDYNEQAYLRLSSKQKYFDYKIYLNQNNQFKQLKIDQMIFNNLPKVYEELADILDIDIRKNLIHEQFRKYINQTNQIFNFDIIKMENRILNHFDWNKIFLDQKSNQIYRLKQFQSLFRLLMTFKCLDNQTIGMVKRFTDFQKIQPFTFKQNTNDLHKFRNQITNKLLAQFTQGFTIYFSSLSKQNTQLKTLLSYKINIKYFDQCIDFLRDLFKDKLLGQSLGKLPIKLAWNGTFVNQNTLSKLNDKVQYPEQIDIQIYNIGFSLKKTLFNQTYEIQKLQERLVHPLYNKDSLVSISCISYKQLYNVLQKNWSTITLQPSQVHQILTYISQINRLYHYATHMDQTIKEKYFAWKNDIQKRLQKLFNLKLKNKELQQEPIIEFLYRLIDNKQQLSNAQLIYQNNGNTLYFTTLCQQLNLAPNISKMQQPKQKAKM